MERFYLRKTVGLKFQLKSIQSQILQYQLGAQTYLFEYTFGPEVDAHGSKSGVEVKTPEDRDHVRHLVKWMLKEKKMYLMGFGYNYTAWKTGVPPSDTDQVGYTVISFEMGRLENSAELSRTLLNRSYTIIGHRKDIMIEDESGAFHLLDVENKRIAEAEHKLDQEEWKKAQRTTNVTLPEEKDERYQSRRDNTRRTQAQGGARYKWKQSNQIYLPSDTEYDYIEDERHQYKSLKPGTKYRVEKHYQQKFSNPSARSSLARAREPSVEPSNPNARSLNLVGSQKGRPHTQEGVLYCTP